MGEVSRKARRRGRKSDEAASVAPRSRAYRKLRHPFKPQGYFSDDYIGRIHQEALRVLQELGIKILLPEARAIFKQAGAIVHEESLMVHIGADLVESALATAPKSIPFRAPNPDNDLMLEEGAMIFYPGAGCPNVYDRQRGRRPGRLADFEETIKLMQAFDAIHMLGPSVEPQDVPTNRRHYATMKTQMTCADKPLFAYSRGQQQAKENFEMIRLGLDLDEATFAQSVWCLTIINTNSPRQIDQPMAQGVIDFARAGQLAIVTPFCLAGAMAPITLAGAMVLQHAEALATICLTQMTKAGAPILYGGFASNVDMKSGAPAFGTPEHLKMTLITGQLARFIGLPWRGSAGSASNTADMQAGNETLMGMWGALQANATIAVHSAGWLEGGLSFGYEKFINDMESLQIFAELCNRPTEDEASLAWTALSEVQPGGHFLGCAHTMERYKDAFYAPLVADLRNVGAWREAGAQRSDQRATSIWQEVLASFEPPAKTGEIEERLTPYIEKRSAAGGAPILD